MKYGKSLIFISALAVVACRHEPEAVATDSKTPAGPKISSISHADPATGASESELAGPAKASDRSNETPRKPPAGTRIPGTEEVKSPFSEKTINVAGMQPGTVIKDPLTGKEFTVPENSEEYAGPLKNVVVAVAVPGKPGMVYSPFNNKIVDVTGIPAGQLVSDPTFPGSDHKIFRVPPSEAAPEEAPAKQ